MFFCQDKVLENVGGNNENHGTLAENKDKVWRCRTTVFCIDKVKWKR